jgi:hypothetical protein
MTDCPNCEYHRQRAQRWREEAYKQAGHPLPDREQEPVAFINVEQRKLEWAKYVSWGTPTVVNLPKIPLYTTPPQRTWVGLTDDAEIFAISNTMPYANRFEFARAIEAKLKEKNG